MNKEIKKDKSRLTFIENAGRIKYPKSTVLLVKCKCDCGNIIIVRKPHFINGHTLSCGCYLKERLSNISKTHGMSNTRTYRCWATMITRCTNKNIPKYKNYGERGIAVCKEWRESFQVFLNDMGVCPDKNHSIDRINNNGNYQKDNCKWSNKIEQCSNKNNNSKYNYKGKLITTTEISRLTGITRSRISNWKNRSKYSNIKIEQLIIDNAT